MTLLTIRSAEPFTAMDRLREEVNRLFERRSNAGDGAGGVRWHPPAHLIESENDVVVRLPLPGIGPDKLTVTVEGGVLRIQGERPAEDLPGEPVRRERLSGAFAREIEVPVPVDADAIQAGYRNGVLSVTLPKSAAAKPRRIQVKSE